VSFGRISVLLHASSTAAVALHFHPFIPVLLHLVICAFGRIFVVLHLMHMPLCLLA